MNILTDAWLDVVRADGTQDVVTIEALFDTVNPPVRLSSKTYLGGLGQELLLHAIFQTAYIQRVASAFRAEGLSFTHAKASKRETPLWETRMECGAEMFETFKARYEGVFDLDGPHPAFQISTAEWEVAKGTTFTSAKPLIFSAFQSHHNKDDHLWRRPCNDVKVRTISGHERVGIAFGAQASAWGNSVGMVNAAPFGKLNVSLALRGQTLWETIWLNMYAMTTDWSVASDRVAGDLGWSYAENHHTGNDFRENAIEFYLNFKMPWSHTLEEKLSWTKKSPGDPLKMAFPSLLHVIWFTLPLRYYNWDAQEIAAPGQSQTQSESAWKLAVHPFQVTRPNTQSKAGALPYRALATPFSEKHGKALVGSTVEAALYTYHDAGYNGRPKALVEFDLFTYQKQTGSEYSPQLFYRATSLESATSPGKVHAITEQTTPYFRDEIADQLVADLRWVDALIIDLYKVGGFCRDSDLRINLSFSSDVQIQAAIERLYMANASQKNSLREKALSEIRHLCVGKVVREWSNHLGWSKSSIQPLRLLAKKPPLVLTQSWSRKWFAFFKKPANKGYKIDAFAPEVRPFMYRYLSTKKKSAVV